MIFKLRKLQSIKCLICFLFFFQSVSAGTLTSTEIAIQQSAKKESDQALTLLKEVVNINSGTTNIQGVYEVGNRLRPLFEEMGFKTYWSDPPKGKNRAGTLFAERSGKKGKRILLISHLDTVFPKNSAFQHFTSEGRLAKGPGIIDAKGGDIVILYALKALASVKALDDVTIIVALVGDEEDSAKPTKFSRKALIDIGKKSDVALDFEPSLALESATIARRGISSFLIEAQGSDVHSSGIFSETAGFGAVFELTRILNTMQVELAKEKYLTFSPSLLLGGTSIHYDLNDYTGNVVSKKNIVAKMAMTNSDLRFLTDEQEHRAQEVIQRIVNEHLPKTNASVTFKPGIPAMPPTEKNKELLERYSEASIDLGFGAVHALDPGLRGAGDISHVAAFVPANLAGLGPVGWGAHSADETLEVSTLPIAIQRAALLIYRLTR